MFAPIPYSFYEAGTVHFWVYYGLVILGFVFAVVTCIAQWAKPAPYGKFDSVDANWGPLIPQRLCHMLSDGVTGVIMFTLVFFLYNRVQSDKDVINYIFYSLFMVHTLHRAIIHPLMMRYRSPSVPLGILLGSIFPNALYQWLMAEQIGVAEYDSSYCYDPRFLLGILMYVFGFVVNRWADWRLRSLRATKGSKGYYVPYGGLFELVSCPNYFGEFVQWIGWTMATWSLSALVWALFSSATFFARSRHNHQWYRDHFEDYPRNRKAFIPFVF